MSRTTGMMLSIQTANNSMGKALDNFAFHCDQKQYVCAGIELGRIQELAKRIEDVCFLAKDALWEDSQG